MSARVGDRIELAKRRLLLTVARAAKACFLGEDQRPTLEGGKLLTYLRALAKLDRGYFQRDGQGRIDPLASARVEGRREVVLEIIKLLNLDPREIGTFVEVDNGQA